MFINIYFNAQGVVREQNGHIAEPQNNCVQSERCESGAVSCDAPQKALRRQDTFDTVAYPEICFGGVQQIQLTGGRENRDLGAVAP
jgi:hypothetical protein